MSETVEISPDKYKLVITGGAGLVGQNLLVKMAEAQLHDVCVLDKCSHNLGIASAQHKGASFVEADLLQPGPWQKTIGAADVVVMLHAQIGGNDAQEFHVNNVLARYCC
jgi:nucleoside-diphosphate-sugar epimerase